MASTKVHIVDQISNDEEAMSEDDVASGSDENMSSEEELEKDATELELEKLVFGDAAGFKDNIREFRTALAYGEGTDAVEVSAEQDGRLAVIDDADVSKMSKQAS